jgi:geranylgeranyl transferase type-2 subunit alpha
LFIDNVVVHCWNYRWFLTETFNVSVQAEFDFTTLMIYRNFSNYSAWHRRSLLFPRLEPIIGQQALLTAIDSDLRLIKSAYFTEPADQSCWFYLRWLLDFAGNRLGDKRDALYKQELDNISELLSIEPEAPLALVTWVHLAAQVGIPQEQIVGKLRVLERIDPLRAGMYQGIINKDYSTVM